jgi:hypothetical protein
VLRLHSSQTRRMPRFSAPLPAAPRAALTQMVMSRQPWVPSTYFGSVSLARAWGRLSGGDDLEPCAQRHRGGEAVRGQAHSALLSGEGARCESECVVGRQAHAPQRVGGACSERGGTTGGVRVRCAVRVRVAVCGGVCVSVCSLSLSADVDGGTAQVTRLPSGTSSDAA